MLEVFREMDVDETGTITMDEFLTHLDDDRVIAYFNSMKLDVSDATALFKLLDTDRSGSVEINEFIDGCQKLKGESRTLDMHLMRYELQYLRQQLNEFSIRFYSFAEHQGVKDLYKIKCGPPGTPEAKERRQLKLPSMTCSPAEFEAQVASITKGIKEQSLRKAASGPVHDAVT